MHRGDGVPASIDPANYAPACSGSTAGGSVNLSGDLAGQQPLFLVNGIDLLASL
jgi:hypothetical protein